jgi:putative transposase
MPIWRLAIPGEAGLLSLPRNRSVILRIDFRIIEVLRNIIMYKRSRLIHLETQPRAIQENGDPRGRAIWHSRGYVPHFDSSDAIQLVTLHLSDSLPFNAMQRMDSDLRGLPPKRRTIERRKRIDDLADAGFGSCNLRRPIVANMVQSSFLTFDNHRYRLLEWVVMPNHVHVLFQPLKIWTVPQIVTSWKRFTARKMGEIEAASGRKVVFPVWHREYWDRYIRNAAHLARAIDYIRSNPVKAGLATSPEEWPWSSAHLGSLIF